jgi:heme O synthase-like polyprenyltransferase
VPVVRIVALLTAIAIGVLVLGWMLTGERRWLRLAWQVFRYALFCLVAVLLLLAAEHLAGQL